MERRKGGVAEDESTPARANVQKRGGRESERGTLVG